MTVKQAIYRRWMALLLDEDEVVATQQTAIYLRQLVTDGVVSGQALVPGFAFLVSQAHDITHYPKKLGELVRAMTCDVDEGRSVIATVLAGQDKLARVTWHFDHPDQEWPEDDPLGAEVEVVL